MRLFCQDLVAQRNGPVAQRVCSFAQRVITGRPTSKSSHPARRRFSEVVIVSKSYTKLGAGVWGRDRTRKETKKRHSRARRLHNNSSIPSNSSILCSRCLGVTKLLLIGVECNEPILFVIFLCNVISFVVHMFYLNSKCA